LLVFNGINGIKNALHFVFNGNEACKSYYFYPFLSGSSRRFYAQSIKLWILFIISSFKNSLQNQPREITHYIISTSTVTIADFHYICHTAVIQQAILYHLTMHIIRLASVLLALLPYVAYGQNTLGIPLVFNYDKAVFQGGSRTWDIRQDSRGMMYFANNDGLITFDGRYWNLYPLPNNTILRSLYIDENDRIYAGGQGEFGYFEGGTDTQLHYTSLCDLIPQRYQKFADVWHTAALGASVFFRTTDRIFELTRGRITVHTTASEWQFLGHAGGRLFAQDRDKGLLEYRDNRWSPLEHVEILEGIPVAGVLSVGKDSILVASITNKTYLLQGHALRHIDTGSWQDLYTPSLSKISDAEYVIGTASEGCIVRTLDGRVVQRIAGAEGLQNTNVSAVFIDKDRNIWAGVDNAIAVINYSSAVKYFRPNLENDVTGLSTQIFENNLYLSSSNGVYVAPLAKDLADHSFSQGEFSLVTGSDRGEAWRLQEVNGQLLLAHNDGVFVIQDKVARPIAAGSGSWMFLPLSSAHQASRVLVGTYHGVDLLHYSNGAFQKVGTLKGPSDSYRFLERDENGDIWASHPYRGIYRLSLSTDSTGYTVRLFTDEDGLPSPFQNYVFKISNRIVFATEAGVYAFDAATQRFVPSASFTSFRGIPIKYLRDDADGNIWFCSGKKIGIARFTGRKSAYDITYFPEIEGLNTSGFENIYPYDKHNSYIGSEKGIIHINYEKYRTDTPAPKVLLSSVNATGKKDSTLFGGYFRKKPGGTFVQDRSHIPKLPSTFDSFHFVYGSPSYGMQAQVTYSYWLEGYDTGWSAWSADTEKDYTNLSNGTYTFKLKARNNLHHESAVVSYTFIICPPWYKTIWAMLGYLIAVLIGIYLVIRWQQNAWRRAQHNFQKKLEQLRYIHQLEIEKNEKEIVKLQNEMLENEVLLKTKELANASMQLMENTDALHKLKVELAKINLGAKDDNDLIRITSLLKDIEKNSAHWDQFASHFDELNDGFLNRLKAKHPNLSRTDLKVCAYLLLNFSSKQIAQLQNISVRGVEIHRYRLRKKLGLPTGQSLSEYLANI